MTSEDQIKFINDLTENVLKDIIGEVGRKIPENWDGIELRWLLAEKFAAQTFHSLSPTRYKEYENNVIVNNI